MEVREWNPKDLPSQIKPFDILNLIMNGENGETINVFVYPEELLEIGELCISAYGNYLKDKHQKGEEDKASKEAQARNSSQT